MMRHLLICLSVFLISCATSIGPVNGNTEFKVKNVVLDLPGKWKHIANPDGSHLAYKESNGEGRALIVSVYGTPTIMDGAKLMAKIHDYLENLQKENPSMEVDSSFKPFKSESGLPFEYISFKDNSKSGFFIGATLGSNQGLVFITYEGNETPKVGVMEIKGILNTLSISNET